MKTNRHNPWRWMMAAGLCLSLTYAASGVTLFWDGTDTNDTASPNAGQGGTGTWDDGVTTNWYNGAGTGGNDNVAWNNANNDVASFGGIAATVTVGSNITAGGLAFTVGGYTFNPTASETITLGGASAITSSGGTLAGTTIINNNLITTGVSTFSYQGLLTIAGDIALGGTLTLNPNTTVVTAMTVSGVISGNFGVNKGTGNSANAALSGANTFDGPVSIGRSGLVVSSIGNWAPGNATPTNLGSPTTAANGQINLGAAGTGGTLIYTGVGETTNRTINLAGTTGGGTIQNDGSGPLTFNFMTVTGNGAKTFTLAGSNADANTFAGTITDSAGGVTHLAKGGVGTWHVTGPNTFTGKTSLSGGPLVVGSLNRVVGGSASSNLGAPTTVANGTIDFGSGNTGGILVYTGAGEITDRVINLAANGNGGATIQNNGSGPLVFTSNVTSTGTGTNMLTLQGSNGGTIQGSIPDATGGNRKSLVKAGAGLWELQGANTYTGSTTVNGGVLRAVQGVGLPAGGSANSFLTLSGGVWESSADMVRGLGSGDGDMRITGGNSGFSAHGAPVNVAFGSLATPTALTWATANFNPAALVLNETTADNTLDFKNAVNFGAATRQVNVHANVATISGVLSSGVGGGLSKAGAGTLVLTNSNTYTGGTTVAGGTLRVNNTTGSGTGTGAVLVQGGATLGGEGFISGPLSVSSGGTLAPGNSPGQLTVHNSVTLAAGSVFDVELDGSVPGSGYDQLVVTGAGSLVTLTGSTLVVTLNFAPALNQQFVIIDNQSNTGVVGMFTNGLTLLTTYNSTPVTMSIDYTGGSGNDVVLTNLTSFVIPEPTAALALGIGAMMGFRRGRGRVHLSDPSGK